MDNSPSELNNNVLLLEFYNSHFNPYPRGCSCGNSISSHKQNPTLVEIKGCGARVMNISKTDFRESGEESNISKKRMRMTVPTFQEHSNSLYIQPAVNFGLVALNLDLFLGLAGASGEEERDEESNRSKKKMRMTILTLQKHFNSLTIQPAVNSELVAPNLELSLGLAGASGDEERDEESNRSKKKMQMTVLTLQKHFNSLTIQPAVNSEPVAPNLKLFLGLARASGEVSSGSKVPSTSRNFCGDGASSFDPCLGGESLHFEPLIIEQQNTGTSDEDPVEISLNPKLT